MLEMVANSFYGFGDGCGLTESYVKNDYFLPLQDIVGCGLTEYYVKRSNKNEEYEENQYFYHPDHLGSSSFITNAIGYAEQLPIAVGVQYLPFGELFVNQQNSTYDTRYKFSAKLKRSGNPATAGEKDNETGYNYFGFRYLDTDLSVWLSVDPMSDKYPNLSPYSYAANNPLIITDPNGDTLRFAEGSRFWFKVRVKFDMFFLSLKSRKMRKEIQAIKNDENIVTIHEMSENTRQLCKEGGMVLPKTYWERISNEPTPIIPDVMSLVENQDEIDAYREETESGNYRPHLKPPGDDAKMYLSYSKGARNSLKGQYQNFRVRTGHEFHHAFNIVKGRVHTGPHDPKYRSAEEENAVMCENTIIHDLNRTRIIKLKTRDQNEGL